MRFSPEIYPAEFENRTLDKPGCESLNTPTPRPIIIFQHLLIELIHSHDPIKIEVTESGPLHLESSIGLSPGYRLTDMRSHNIIDFLRDPYLFEILLRHVNSQQTDSLQDGRIIGIFLNHRYFRSSLNKGQKKP